MDSYETPSGMQELMENSDALDARIGPLVDGPMASVSNIGVSTAPGSDSAFNEKFLLDEMDSYLDDLSTRITVSRMVSDSIIKGIVNAVVEETTEKIASKESEITMLNKRLQQFETATYKDKLCPSMVISETQRRKSLSLPSSDASSTFQYDEHLGMVETAEHLQKLKEDINNFRNTSSIDVLNQIDEWIGAMEVALTVAKNEVREICSSKALSCERQWEHEIQSNITTIVVWNLVREAQNEFEKKLHDQRGLGKNISRNWQMQIDDLSTIRQQLDTVLRSSFSYESVSLVSLYSLEGLEDRIISKRKDQSTRKLLGSNNLTNASHPEENGVILTEKSNDVNDQILTDSPQLKHMTKQELITYFKTEMSKMKRQHDLALQEKTEEVFSLKRELLKEKGINPSHFHKDKESEIIRRKISGIISKLDDVLLDDKKLSNSDDDRDTLHNLQEKIDALNLENQRLQSFIANKEKEVGSVSSLANQISHYSSVEEDLKIEAITRDEIQKTILKDLFGQLKIDVHAFEIEFKMKQDICSIIYKEIVEEAASSTNAILLNYSEEMSSMKEALSQKENALYSEIGENKKVKQVIDSYSALVREKEEFASEFESRVVKQKEQFDIICREINMLRDRVTKQDLYISRSSSEFDIIMGRVEQALQKSHLCEKMLNVLNQKLKVASDSLEEAEKQKNILYGVIEEKQKAVALSVAKEEEYKKLMESIIVSIRALSEYAVDCEFRIGNHLECNESRLAVLKNHCNQLTKHAKFLRRETVQYKEISEIRSSDLQKAEIEVDLLGNEVDALLQLLEKVYIALDHYSPVLQHYPGVMEILKIIKQQIKGEASKSTGSSPF
ncbi:WPP domain-associated protein-like isoform X1 [Typha latifolia]|uniref:WPP domain-associated protein-like isoform X1 n=2 Tax=Typha latifolia TaxID=4733 RepID=UPI003C2F2B97